MSKWIKKINFVIILWLLSTVAFAATQSPRVMLQSVSKQMIAALEQNKSRLHKPNVISRIVNRVLVPHVDMSRMAASVVGRRYWRNASDAQRKLFIDQFKRLVISTYAAALASYDGDKIRFYRLRVNYKTRPVVEVRSMIIRKSGQRIPLSYNLHRIGNSWKVYDFSIENVSMVQSYRAQFAGVLTQSGMAGLNQRLLRHNRVRR